MIAVAVVAFTMQDAQPGTVCLAGVVGLFLSLLLWGMLRRKADNRNGGDATPHNSSVDP